MSGTNDTKAKIEQLNKLLDSGRINQKKYDDLLEKIVGGSSQGIAKEKEQGGKSMGCLVVILIIGAIIWMSSPSKEQKLLNEKKAQAQKLIDKKKGFHCLSAWDGSHDGVVEQVKKGLRDPDSFEHVETRVTPEKRGSHTLTMDYRAKNGFGGLNTTTAVAIYNNVGCKATLVTRQ